MPLLKPSPPPYDPLAWAALPYPERARRVCQAWAEQGYGAPLGATLAYGLKIALYVAVWVALCARHPDIAGFSDFGAWWLRPVAFQKAILWSMLFEVLGLGCGSGPLTGRYFPPFGGVLHFARPGTTKLSPLPWLPWLGGPLRTRLDVGLYLALLASLLVALLVPEPSFGHFLVPVILLPILGLADQTLYLAARSEHYLITLFCFLFDAPAWIAGAKAVALALWFWAGISKLNHHFPAVVCVMQSNSPLPFPGGLGRLYRNAPEDLTPSRLAERLAHIGTGLELAVPICLGFGGGGPLTVLGFVLMLLLHAFITSSVPMGVPLEWNVMVVYGAFFLFGAHAEVSVLSVPPLLGAVLLVSCVVVPLVGNLTPSKVSFLLSMRYYAGNWPFGVWLFEKGAHTKLEAVKKSSPWVMDQLGRFYDEPTSIGLFGKVLAFRSMHLHGRVLPKLLARMVDRFEDYDYVDGEIVAGLVLGYNFGDGHLHSERLLELVQAQCGFEPGELRCLFVESQPLHRSTLQYRIHDAATGLREAGRISVDELRGAPPWPTEAEQPS